MARIDCSNRLDGRNHVTDGRIAEKVLIVHIPAERYARKERVTRRRVSELRGAVVPEVEVKNVFGN